MTLDRRWKLWITGLIDKENELMELILASIAAAGLVGASNQYMFILLLGLASRFGLVQLAPEMTFMSSIGFNVAAGVLWILSVAPAYSSHFSPGVANVINTISNVVHGFVVPVSAAMVGLAVAGGGALLATSLTGAKAASKPGINTATGTIGHVSAPIWATVETIAAGLLVALFAWLASLSPWLLVGAAAAIAVLILAVMVYSFFLLWKFGKGLGKVLRLLDQQPKAGWGVVLEFLTWGGGSLWWGYTPRATPRILGWAAWMMILLFLAIPAITIPIAGVAVFFFVFLMGLLIGARSAGGLLKLLESDGHILPLKDVQPAAEATQVPATARGVV